MAETGTHPEYLTVRELADLLRVKERKVYDLAASGQVPCSRATGKLLFPEAEIRAWIARNRSGPSDGSRRPAVFLGSHDPLLDWALRESRSGFATLFDSSLDGLRRFVAGEGATAGLHVHEGESRWNRETALAAAAERDAVLVRWATRRRGLVLRADVVGRVGGVSDLGGLRIVPRQSEAGAELLFQHLLEGAGVARTDLTFATPCRSEQDAVLAVAQGEADVAFGLETVARPYGLAFVPLVDEEFDLLVDRRAWFEPPMQTLLEFASSAAFRTQAERRGGYDVGGLGRVKWNA